MYTLVVRNVVQPYILNLNILNFTPGVQYRVEKLVYDCICLIGAFDGKKCNLVESL